MARPIPVVETRRLLLRPWRANDLEPYAAITSDPEAMRYIGHGRPLSASETSELIARYNAEWERTGCGRWAVEERVSGDLLGNCGIVWFKEATPEAEPEVAYALRRESWAQGFATEAARAAVAWVFSQSPATSAVGLTSPENTRSQRVLAKLGFKPAGTYAGEHGLLNVYRVTRRTFNVSEGGRGA